MFFVAMPSGMRNLSPQNSLSNNVLLTFFSMLACYLANYCVPKEQGVVYNIVKLLNSYFVIYMHSKTCALRPPLGPKTVVVVDGWSLLTGGRC